MSVYFPEPPPEGDPPPTCISLDQILAHRADYPWYPERAVYCGVFHGNDYYRPADGEPPPEPPPGEPPPECVPTAELFRHPENYPWWPDNAQWCGEWYGDNYYRDASGGGGDDSGRDQPQGDVDADLDPDAYLPESLDDLDPFDPD